MNDVIKNLYQLFDAAFEENMNGHGTDITRMVTTFVPDAIQNLQAYESILNVECVHPCKDCDLGWHCESFTSSKSCRDACDKLNKYNENTIHKNEVLKGDEYEDGI